MSGAGFKVVSTGYQPRPLQAKLHVELKRFNVIVCHRRFGKTVFAINHTLNKGLKFNGVDRLTKKKLIRPQYAYLAPTFGQAKRVSWEYLKQYTANIPGVETNEADLRVDIPHPELDFIRIMLLGAENPMALKGLYLDGVVPDEYGEMNPVVWREVIRPTLSDRGGWALFLGTPKGRNNFHDLYDGALNGFPQSDGTRFKDPEWFAAMFKASETGILEQAELDSAKRTMSEEEYEQEYECSFQAGLVGAYWSKEISACEKEGRITAVPYDPMLPVDTYWDLGMNDVTAIWFCQSFGLQRRMIDYVEAPDTSIPEWVSRLREKPYNYNKFYLPHDAEVRDLSTGKTRSEILGNLVGQRNVEVIPRVEDKLDSIHAARMILPRCVFDREKCERGIKALMNYQRKWDTKQNVFSPKPLHNWASNGADAFQQFAMAFEDDNRFQTAPQQRFAESDFHF